MMASNAAGPGGIVAGPGGIVAGLAESAQVLDRPRRCSSEADLPRFDRKTE
jgi:hypothetical protein